MIIIPTFTTVGCFLSVILISLFNGHIWILEGKLAGDWRRLYSEVLHNFYTSPNIIRVTKPRRIRWAEHEAGMGQMRNVDNILVGKPEEKRSL
jgi:hypothetical protein